MIVPLIALFVCCTNYANRQASNIGSIPSQKIGGNNPGRAGRKYRSLYEGIEVASSRKRLLEERFSYCGRLEKLLVAML